MAQWQQQLKLADVWNREDEFSPSEMAGIVAKRLRALRPLADNDLEQRRGEIAEEFEALTGDDSATWDEFNYVLNELYDWGDTSLDDRWNGRKVCWVATF